MSAKIWLWRHIYAINFLSPLCRICVEYIKFDNCAKFDDDQRNSYDRGGGGGGGANPSCEVMVPHD